MAHAGIYATSAECLEKAGANYNSTAVIEAVINNYCLQVEGIINTVARHVFATTIAGFAALPAGGKYILTSAASCWVGMKMLAYKPTGEDGYLNRIEFEDRVNILRDEFLTMIGIIRDEKFKTFIVDGA